MRKYGVASTYIPISKHGTVASSSSGAWLY